MANIEISNDEVREQLAPILKEIKGNIENAKASAREKGLRLKRNPVLNLYEQGCLTVDYLMEEHGKVLDKTTNHSSSERHMISGIMGTALNRALGKKIQQITEKLDEIEDGEERKTE